MQCAKQYCRRTCELILYSSRALHGRSALEKFVQLESTFLMVDMMVSSEILPDRHHEVMCGSIGMVIPAQNCF